MLHLGVMSLTTAAAVEITTVVSVASTTAGPAIALLKMFASSASEPPESKGKAPLY